MTQIGNRPRVGDIPKAVIVKVRSWDGPAASLRGVVCKDWPTPCWKSTRKTGIDRRGELGECSCPAKQLQSLRNRLVQWVRSVPTIAGRPLIVKKSSRRYKSAFPLTAAS